MLSISVDVIGPSFSGSSFAFSEGTQDGVSGSRSTDRNAVNSMTNRTTGSEEGKSVKRYRRFTWVLDNVKERVFKKS